MSHLHLYPFLFLGLAGLVAIVIYQLNKGE